MPYTYLQLLGYLSHYNKLDFSSASEAPTKPAKVQQVNERQKCQLRLFHAKTRRGRTLAVFKCAGSRQGGNLNGRNPPCGAPECRVCSRFVGECATRKSWATADVHTDLWVKDLEKESTGLFDGSDASLRSLRHASRVTRTEDYGSAGKTTIANDRADVPYGKPRIRRLRLTVRKPEDPKTSS